MLSIIFKILIIGVVVKLVLTAIGSLNIGISLNVLPIVQTLSSFFSVICYLLPMRYLAPLFVLVISIQVFKIIISIIRTIWDLLPIV